MQVGKLRFISKVLSVIPIGLCGSVVTSGMACSGEDNAGVSFGGNSPGGSGAGASGSGGSSGSLVGGAGGTLNVDAGAGGASGSGPIDPDAACADDIRQGGLVDVNMLVMFDRSGSMDDEISDNETRWDAASTALKAFFQDPASAGLNVALRFFPHDSPASGCNDDDCDEAACAEELVPIGSLTADSAPTDVQEGALVSAVDNSVPGDRGGQGGGTPTYAALSGAAQWATAYQATHPDERTVIVLVTDGRPNGCQEDTDAIADLAAQARASQGCVECRQESDCESGVCDSVSGNCRQPCRENNDCTGSQWLCDGTLGFCVECATTSHCDDWEPFCVNGSCIECFSDADCHASEPFCETERGRCRECRSDADCLEGQRCNPDGLRCEDNQG